MADLKRHLVKGITTKNFIKCWNYKQLHLVWRQTGHRLNLSVLITCVVSQILILPLTVSAKSHGTQMSPKVVDTLSGQLRGVRITLPNSKLSQVDGYFGIQYASVLNGDLRFMPPTSPFEKWKGPRLALKYRPVCPQHIPDLEALKEKIPLGKIESLRRIIPFLEEQSEECLNLNIYVPVNG